MAVHLVVTDSGVGGLSACAAIERALRASPVGAAARITYVNAWPSEDGGYNDMSDIREEAAVFDRALNAMTALQPDEIVIACNTLSIVFEQTEFRRRLTSTPPRHKPVSSATSEFGPRTSDFGPRTSDLALPRVVGIVAAGVELFCEALSAEPGSRLALFGTKTTIESGVHRTRLMARGISPDRIIPVGCHGLAKSIETEMDGPSTLELIEECTKRAAKAVAQTAGAGRLFLGVCCTHYTYVREVMAAAFARHAGQVVAVLDPTDSLVQQVVPNEETTPGVVFGGVSVVSKVRMPEAKRRLIAARLAPVSPATADALMAYSHIPDLF